ncbi:ubiquinone/menaquinone biosynthesis C-methylase UbiE [Nonomuraea thailandensis]|uniref:Ubiquinone/menaquinone biosynthesis C-methylase UbiE n=1 Tax=Nonomuraea thailandensis TaxID=1188745 RepID=A0A9X2GR82_9ACTN|nr:class I SAM-dependent methyltransferase [Nonomuraea thailandensis]MCP2362465.1 ubiquinone/menaquinone biosynthesis C-methylase UbiE [Nonomuraea thailandensis]
MQDDVYRYNEERWEALVEADALFTRPMLDLDAEKARAYLGLERLGIPGDLTGRRVLCLAGGGGQQSAAFALLGADVTVFDISSGQLERDRSAAEHHGVTVRTVQGDMRDLSALDGSSFELVWHPYSLTFVPDCRVVFREVAKVVEEGGHYYLMCANPFFSGLTHHSWNGSGYPLTDPYTDETVTSYPDQEWVYESSGSRIQEPREYRQTLSRMTNSLIQEGFVLRFLSEVRGDHPGAEPGSWAHFTGVAPPWLEFVWQYRPGALDSPWTLPGR